MAFPEPISIIEATWSWCSNHHTDHLSKILTVLFLSISMIIWYTWLADKTTASLKKHPLPPGPRGLPLLGSLPFIDTQLHTYFEKMSKKYGPIFKIKLGNKLCVVIGSTSTAKEVLRDYDALFANRDATVAVTTFTYDGLGLVWTPYGSHWRTQRMLCVREFFTKGNIDLFYSLRRKELRQTTKLLYIQRGTPVNLSEHIFLTSLKMSMGMLWGGSLENDQMRHEFGQKSLDAVDFMMDNNLSDCFPILAKLDLQGIKRGIRKLHLWFDRVFDDIIDERINYNQANGGITENKDFLDLLLQLIEKPDPKVPITKADIKATFQDLLQAGLDTTTATLIWAMTETIRHPEIMKRIQEELGQVVGENNIVEESHIPKLTYLNAVVKENYRLHQPIPLIPRNVSETCIIGGYTIPKDTRVWMNTYALQRDPEVYENPLEFRPERFFKDTTTSNKSDYGGSNFNYLPFGSGRRVCPGMPVAERTVPYMLATFLHSFDWKSPEGVEPDVSGTLRLLLRKSTYLMAIPTPRLSNPELYLKMDLEERST